MKRWEDGLAWVLSSLIDFGLAEYNSVESVALHCRILSVGPDPDAHRLLGDLARTESGVSLQHIEMGSVALEVLKQLPEPELPNIVIIPFRLAILTSLDFISGMQSYKPLSSIPVLIWGPRIEPWEMGQLYTAGAASVLLGDFDVSHLDAVRNFCRAWTGLKPVLTVNPVPEMKQSSSRKTDRQSDSDRHLGTLFLRTGCISSAFWIWSVLEFGKSYTLIDLAPVPIYGGLTCAGLLLIFGRVKAPVPT